MDTLLIPSRLRGCPFLWEAFRASQAVFIIPALGSCSTHTVTELVMWHNGV